MTITDIADQLVRLAENKMFGIESDIVEWKKLSKASLSAHLRLHRPAVNNDYIMHISLPDGNWLLFIRRYSEKSDGFCYDIPEDREQEMKMLSMARTF